MSSESLLLLYVQFFNWWSKPIICFHIVCLINWTFVSTISYQWPVLNAIWSHGWIPNSLRLIMLSVCVQAVHFLFRLAPLLLHAWKASRRLSHRPYFRSLPLLCPTRSLLAHVLHPSHRPPRAIALLRVGSRCAFNECKLYVPSFASSFLIRRTRRSREAQAEWSWGWGWGSHFLRSAHVCASPWRIASRSGTYSYTYSYAVDSDAEWWNRDSTASTRSSRVCNHLESRTRDRFGSLFRRPSAECCFCFAYCSIWRLPSCTEGELVVVKNVQ